MPCRLPDRTTIRDYSQPFALVIRIGRNHRTKQPAAWTMHGNAIATLSSTRVDDQDDAAAGFERRKSCR
jgi:hypothetical protein